MNTILKVARFLASAIIALLTFTLFAAALQGCLSPRYVEGTDFSAGVYIPTDGTLVGVQVLHYLNGVKVTSSTNQTFTLTRIHATTNSYFGIMSTAEYTKTQVSTSKK